MLEKGAILGGYRIDGLHGQGGMGTVYEATQLSLNRTVALKVLAAALSEDVGFMERFRREGRLQAGLDHPHIVTVYEAGESDYGLFLAMRLIRGPTLKDLILGRELDVGLAMRLLSQVADALDTAHEAQLVHRDIKPQNILVSGRRHDYAYLADFGVTKARGGDNLTKTGMIVGTLDYISPEQIRGHRATSGSDIYALGGVVYECLTGFVPFPMESDAAVIYAHLSEQPPRLSDRRPDLPRTLDDVLAKAMAKDPAERYATAAELLGDISAALGTTGASSLSAPGPAESPEDVGIRRPEEMVSTPAVILPPGGKKAIPTETTPAGRAPVLEPTLPAERAIPEAPSGGLAEPPTRARRARRRVAVSSRAGLFTGALIATLCGAGFLAGRAVDDPGAKAPPKRRSAVVAAGRLELSVPPGWRRVENAPSIPNLPLTRAVSFALGGSPSRMSFLAGSLGRVEPPMFLTASFVKRLDRHALRWRNLVRLSRLAAIRYGNLAPAGSGRRLTLYVVPDVSGSWAIACRGVPLKATRPSGACDRIAATANIDGVEPYQLLPTAAYAAVLRRAISAVNTVRANGARELRSARTKAGQARTLTEIARAYATAERRLRTAPATPLVRPANASIRRAFQRAKAAYSAAAAAARAGSRTRYKRSRRAVLMSERTLQRELEGLVDFGFEL